MERLLTFREIAEGTGFPEGTLRYWRHTGEGPEGYRIGRRVYFPESKVEEWLRAKTSADAQTNAVAS